MQKISKRWGRLALAAVVVAACATLVLPASAFAKAATRIVVTKQAVADWGTPGVTPDAPVVTAKLQKKSGSRWVALKGKVKLYYYNVTSPAWTYVGSATASSLHVTMPVRGKYKVSYAGSSTTKPTYSYTKRVDRIGETISDVTANFATIDSTWTRVTVSYDVNWNTEAYPVYQSDDFLEVGCLGAFVDDQGSHYGLSLFSQQVWQPGTTEVSYRVRTANIPDPATLVTTGMVLSDDPYILTSASIQNETPFSLD
jgi:hypothetical protein